MQFTSFLFLVFFIIVFVLIYVVFKTSKAKQNIALLAASYYFYSCWDWRFLGLLIFSSLLDYYSGIKIHAAKTSITKKIWLWLSVSINLSFLGVFKYYNFFADTFAQALTTLGLQVNVTYLHIILPVGISFYTFHGLSYIIDIYKSRIKPEHNLVDYGLFVSYFPLLVAGPIERATHLLPQIKQCRTFNYALTINGLKQILWGVVKKVVIADTCAEYVNIIFNSSVSYGGSTYVVGAVLFAFQIYGDFSGYSDVALGCSRILGIELIQNFSFPYFSRSVAEFWRRWHISLSSWFKDYLYIPLGGSSGSKLMQVRNTFIIFLVSGFWHGASFNFIIWGLLNALFIMPSVLLKTNRQNTNVVAQGKLLPSFKEVTQIVITFALTTITWVFFRTFNLKQAITVIGAIFSSSLLSLPTFTNSANSINVLFAIIVFLIIEWCGREQAFAISTIGNKWSRFIRWTMYAALILLILLCTKSNETPFIYFQF